MNGRNSRGLVAVAVCCFGLAGVGRAQILSNGAEASDSRGSSPLQGPVSTGNKSLDILLDAHVAGAPVASAPHSGGSIGSGVTEILRAPEALSKSEQQGFKDALLREAVNTTEQEARRQEREAQRHPPHEEQGRRVSLNDEGSQGGGAEAAPGEARVTNGFILFLRENRYWILVIAAGTAMLVWIKSARVDARRGEAPRREERSAGSGARRNRRHRSRSRH